MSYIVKQHIINPHYAPAMTHSAFGEQLPTFVIQDSTRSKTRNNFRKQIQNKIITVITQIARMLYNHSFYN
jgi:hypothetical protein